MPTHILPSTPLALRTTLTTTVIAARLSIYPDRPLFPPRPVLPVPPVVRATVTMKPPRTAPLRLRPIPRESRATVRRLLSSCMSACLRRLTRPWRGGARAVAAAANPMHSSTSPCLPPLTHLVPSQVLRIKPPPAAPVFHTLHTSIYSQEPFSRCQSSRVRQPSPARFSQSVFISSYNGKRIALSLPPPPPSSQSSYQSNTYTYLYSTVIACCTPRIRSVPRIPQQHAAHHICIRYYMCTSSNMCIIRPTPHIFVMYVAGILSRAPHHTPPPTTSRPN